MFNYLKAVVREFKNVKWPTTKVAIYYTVGVIFVAFFIAVYIGVLDITFINLVDKFLILFNIK